MTVITEPDLEKQAAPGLLKTIKRSLIASYDYLGYILLCSLMWFGVWALYMLVVNALRPGIALSLVIGAAFFILVMSPITSGAFRAARNILMREGASPMDILQGARELLLPSWVLALTQVALTGAIVANIVFYLQMDSPALKLPGILFGYILLFWSMSAIYHYPLLAEQNPGVFTILKRSSLLVMDNPGFTAGMFSAIILLTCLCAVSLFLMPLAYIGVVSVLQTCALRALFVKYGMLPPEPEPATGGDPGFRIR